MDYHFWTLVFFSLFMSSVNASLSEQSTHKRLLASSSNWEVGVIIVGIIGMLAFFGLVGYMVVEWKFMGDSSPNQPPPTQQREPHPKSNSQPSTGAPAEMIAVENNPDGQSPNYAMN